MDRPSIRRQACRLSSAPIGCHSRRYLTATVRHCAALTLALGLAWRPASADEPGAGDLTQQQELDRGWLTLEQDRQVYRSEGPPGSLDEARMQDLRLQQQGLRDSQDLRGLDQQNQVQRQRAKVRGNQVTPSGASRLRYDRTIRNLRLRNRMQRNTWPRP